MNIYCLWKEQAPEQVMWTWYGLDCGKLPVTAVLEMEREKTEEGAR